MILNPGWDWQVSRKKNSWPATKRGEGRGKSRANKKKNFFKVLKKYRKNVAAKLEGGGCW